MGSKDNVYDRYFATQTSSKESNRRLKFLLKCIQKLSAEQLDAEHSSHSAESSYEPSSFVPQVILRRQGLVPVDMLVRLHSLFKCENRDVNEVSNGLDQDDPNALLMYCVLSALRSEKFKVTTQLAGISSPDAGMTKQTQELFEQFYDAHGTPNDAEKDLLVQVGYVNRNVVDQWFAGKESRLRAVASFELRILDMMKEDPGFIAGVALQEFQRLKGKKSLLLH